MALDARIDPGWLRAVAVDTAVLVRALEPGQRLVGRVLQVTGENQFLLVLGERRMLAQSALPLTPGQQIAVEVTKTGPTVELRLLQAPQAPETQLSAAEADQRLALAALITSVRQHTQAAQMSAPPDAPALLRALLANRQGGRTSLPPQDLERLATMLVPLASDAGTPALAAALENAFSKGGLLFEAHLRQLLDANPGMSVEQALERLKDDARAVLARVLTADADAGAHAGGKTPLAAAAEALMTQMLARQADMGLHWVADGTLRLDVPVHLPSGDAHASLQVRREREHESSPEQTPACSVVFRVTSPVFGVVDTRASWRGRSLTAVVSVEREDTRTWLEAELASLTQGLAATFDSVSADIRTDAVRTLGTQGGEMLPELPAGSIVNVRA